jgi:hypothetical protein
MSHMNIGAISLAAESLSLGVLIEGWQSSGGHRLKSLLLVTLRTSESGVLAITYLDTEEYGWGKTEDEAITDLMTSLVEYMESLEGRRDQLGDPAVVDLERLHALFT